MNGYQEIPLSEIRPSPCNPRKRRDPAAAVLEAVVQRVQEFPR